MSEPKSIVDVQVQHLLNVVEQHRDAQCSKLSKAARDSAEKLIATAHSNARQRLHDDIEQTRESSHQQLTSTQARLQTRKRLARQELDEALLQAAWKQLKDSLQSEWDNFETRRQWIESMLDAALAMLVSDQWRIEHPVDLTDEDAAALQLKVFERLGHSPELEATDHVPAGLRICTDGACVDGTIEGLMHDRPRIEASILAAVHDLDESDHG